MQEGQGGFFRVSAWRKAGAINHNALFPSQAEELQSWLLRFAGYRSSRFFSVKVTILLLTGIIIRAWMIEATGIADAGGLGISQAPASP
jgi:hypothetical protein